MSKKETAKKITLLIISILGMFFSYFIAVHLEHTLQFYAYILLIILFAGLFVVTICSILIDIIKMAKNRFF